MIAPRVAPRRDPDQGEPALPRFPVLPLALLLALGMAACGPSAPPGGDAQIERGTALPPPGLTPPPARR
jgi:hypothetical protein